MGSHTMVMDLGLTHSGHGLGVNTEWSWARNSHTEWSWARGSYRVVMALGFTHRVVMG